MTALAIRARFPLGIFLGHQPDGQSAQYPDTARLHAALLHSAGKGSFAVDINGDLRATPASLSALQWLENHPPSVISMPRVERVALPGEPTRSFRDEGVFEAAQREAPDRRKVAKRQSDAVALAGPFGWAWEEDAPADVVATIAGLCEDVSCLGEADTPVILEVGDVDPTHWLDRANTAFPAPGGVPMRTPLPGRVDELERDYAVARPKLPPSAARDRYAIAQRPSSHTPGAARTVQALYRAKAPVIPDLPWVAATAIPVGRSINPTERVLWCVALHRALTAFLGDAALSLLTGRYIEGCPQPANRVAIQFLDADVLGREDCPHGAFLLLAPSGASPEDLAVVSRCARGVRDVYRRGESAISLAPEVAVDVEDFWPAPGRGQVRYWRTVPGIVTETRRQRAGGPWSLEDAALLAIGHVFRDRLGEGPADSARYRWIVDEVRRWGVTVHDVHPIHDSRVERYAHKLPKGVVAQPFTARFHLADLVSDTALLAVGQSRHLGGGLLVPADESAASARALYGWQSSC
jgi:CRISPR-associated protein Csb2